jgi:hypothetical protein
MKFPAVNHCRGFLFHAVHDRSSVVVEMPFTMEEVAGMVNGMAGLATEAVEATGEGQATVDKGAVLLSCSISSWDHL